MKKILTLALCLCIAMSTILTGCGKSEQTTGTNSKEVTKLKWYAIGQEPQDLEKVLAKANEYLEEKINAHIDMKYIDFGEYTQKFSVVLNAGDDYDLAFSCSWAGDYLGNARKGAFLELEPYFDNIAKDMKAAIDQRFWDGAKIDGKTYAVPNQKELGVAPMWVFTKEYVDKYNVPYQDIHTLEDLEPWLKIIKENEPDVVPLYITKQFSPPLNFDQLKEPLGIGIELDDASLTIKNMFETEEMKKAIKTLNHYYKEEYINQDSAMARDDDTVKRFVTKGDGQPYAEKIWSKKLGYQVVVSPIVDPYITNTSTTGSMIAVNKNSKNPEKAVEFLNLLNTDEYLRNLINYGIKGDHYNKIGDNQIKVTDNYKAYDVPYFALGNLFITYVLHNEPTSKWEEFKEFNDNAGVSPALGFKFNTEPVNRQLASINNVVEEFKQTLYSGSVDADEYLAKLNKKLKEQGMDEVIDEMQRQMDEWKKIEK